MHHFVNLDNVSNVMLSRNDIKLHVDSIILDKKNKQTKKGEWSTRLIPKIIWYVPFLRLVSTENGRGGGGVCFFEKGADSIFCYKNFQSA